MVWKARFAPVPKSTVPGPVPAPTPRNPQHNTSSLTHKNVIVVDIDVLMIHVFIIIVHPAEYILPLGIMSLSH